MTTFVAREKSMKNGQTDKIVLALSLLGNRDVTVDGKLVTSSSGRLPVHITSTFFRSLICNPDCRGICCISTASHIDYLPTEKAFRNLPHEEQDRFDFASIVVNGVSYPLKRSSKSTMGTKPDMDRPAAEYCQFLVPRTDGKGLGCGLHQYGLGNKPLICHSCLEVSISEVRGEIVRMGQRPLGRSWLYDPPPMCEFEFQDLEGLDVKIDILRRYREWSILLDIPEATARLETILVGLQQVRRSGKIPMETIVVP